MPKADQPAAKFRLGFVTASVWKNGSGFFNVTVQRSYKEDDEWKNSESFNAGDLLNAAKVLTRAEEWISQQQ
jgi:hypothetical protein